MCSLIILVKYLTIQLLLTSLPGITLAQQTIRPTACGKYKWSCNNGQCIESHQLCDGTVNCRDRSDETPDNCNQIICPVYSFRCTYGACVAGMDECDNEKDCADNSDEKTFNCPGIVESLSGTCMKTVEYQCGSGECIKSSDLCDGIVNCRDGSDETEKLCSNEFCPIFAFKCDYGACISGTAKCDRKKDCADTSDESFELCGYTFEVNTPSRVPDITPPEGSCVIPQPPENGRIVFAADPTKELRQGQFIEPGQPIEYKCYSKYVLVGQNTDYCYDGLWLGVTPKCNKYCDPLPLHKISINALCEYNKKGISCMQPLPPGTRVSITCKAGYYRPDRKLPDIIVCDSSGEWNFHPWKCEEDCGVPSPDIIPFVVGGEITEIRKVPWHAAIYALPFNNPNYGFLCGGSIISSRVIVSAAHCFWNPIENVFYDKSRFLVAVGKSLRDLTAKEETIPQFFNVSELITKQEYNHEEGLFYQDIAVLVTTDFIIFNAYILPVCIDFKLVDNEKYIPSGWNGLVAGWGRIQSNGELSDDLKLLRLPSVDYLSCRNESPPNYRKYITGDKFCAGHLTGESVCQGDSGGGLAFPRIIDETETFYLYGIVSSGPAKENSCDNTKYSLFTNIHIYINMIREVYLTYLAL